jgi:hypothetical protein
VTAEIAVMNQSAVALAADSAATRSQTKIFSANKIFAVSKRRPVAVMIFGAAACMGVPWETIIKQFRDELGDTNYPHVHNYGEAMFEFIGANRKLFPESQQEQFAFVYAFQKFSRVRRDIVEGVERKIEASGPVSDADARRIVDEVIAQRSEFWRDRPRRAKLPRNVRRRTREQYGNQIVAARDKVFEQLKLNAKLRERLLQITLDSWYKEPLGGDTGVVFAGFGDDDMFPALVSYQIDGVLLNHPVFWKEREASLDQQHAAVIVPFAQDDMIRLFVEGVTPVYEEFVESYFEEIISGLSSMVGEELPTGPSAASVRARLENDRDVLVGSLARKLAEERRNLYVDPMLSIVESLPMDELASLAESLVNLTSLRRRVSLEQETVGGPIDVAVISRGDGLVWIKRKHYFPKDLNHQFFSNYFRS